jgi:hypothetical protein
MPRPRDVALFLLCFGTYAWFYQAGGWNQNSRFDLTRAIVERGTVRIDAYERNTGDKSLRDGHYYCDKAPGVSWLGVPPLFVMNALFGPAQTTEAIDFRAYLVTLFAVALPSAISVVLLACILRKLGMSSHVATGAAAAWGLASLAFPYSTLIYGHQVAASLFVAAFALLLECGSHAAALSSKLFLAGLLLGFSVACDYSSAIGCLVLTAYAVHCVPRVKPLAALLLGGALVAIAVAAYHTAAFGGPLTTAYAFSTQEYRHVGFMGIGKPRLRAVVNLLFTQYRGIFWSMPWLLFAIYGAVKLRRRAEGAVCIAMFILFFWLNISLIDWQGGWALGARYLIPTLPFLTILAAVALTTRAARIAFTVLATYSFVLMFVGTAVKPEVSVMIGNPFGVNFRTFATDRVAVSYQSIDGYGNVPGPRRAFNLGEKLGLHGRATLLPLLGWIALTGAWTFRAAEVE